MVESVRRSRGTGREDRSIGELYRLGEIFRISGELTKILVNDRASVASKAAVCTDSPPFFLVYLQIGNGKLMDTRFIAVYHEGDG